MKTLDKDYVKFIPPDERFYMTERLFVSELVSILRMKKAEPTRFTCERLFAMSSATAWFSATRPFALAENAAFQPREMGAATGLDLY